MDYFAQNMKHLRDSLGLSQNAFAEKLDITRASVSAYEDGRATPALDKLMTFAQKLGLTIDELYFKDLTIAVDTLANSPVGQLQESKSLVIEKENAEEPIQAFETKSNNRPTLAQIDLFAEYLEESREHHLNKDKSYASQPKSQELSLVEASQLTQYEKNFKNEQFLRQLKVFSLPNLRPGTYRAFQGVEGFADSSAILVGAFISAWSALVDNQAYVVLHKNTGLHFRRVFNLTTSKGTLILSGETNDIAVAEVDSAEVLEIWEIRHYLMNELPKAMPKTERIAVLVDELKAELDKLSKGPSR